MIRRLLLSRKMTEHAEVSYNLTLTRAVDGNVLSYRHIWYIILRAEIRFILMQLQIWRLIKRGLRILPISLYFLNEARQKTFLLHYHFQCLVLLKIYLIFYMLSQKYNNTCQYFIYMNTVIITWVLNGIIHLTFLVLSIIILRDIEMRTWSWSANSIEPDQAGLTLYRWQN